MSTQTLETPTVAETPNTRDCTRCDGTQHLLGEGHGMGKYRCDSCEMTVLFDRDAEFVEIMTAPGAARLYTKDVFGPRLNSFERRL